MMAKGDAGNSTTTKAAVRARDERVIKAAERIARNGGRVTTKAIADSAAVSVHTVIRAMRAAGWDLVLDGGDIGVDRHVWKRRA